jgi:tetratricopeptide (TPR) repeat protein
VLLAVGASDAASQPARDTSALLKKGLAGLDTRQFPVALTAFAEAAAISPGDASLSVGAGVAAFMSGQHDAAQGWFERTLALNPDSLTASEWLGELHYRAGRVDRAIAVYENAIANRPSAPGTEELGRRLASWRRETEVQTDFAELHADGVAVRFKEGRDDALAGHVLARLEAASSRIVGILGASPSQPVSVVLYTREEFEEITRLPAWTAAAYDGRIRLPLSGAPHDEAELDRVLTHELVHAVVATLAGRNAPVWLNEGLATAVEPDGSAGAEAVLTRERAQPSLARLHDTFLRLDTPDAEVAYAVSARAVRRMTELAGTPAIVSLLGDLGRGVPFDRAFKDRLSMRYDRFQASLARN